jgi:xanthine dehydrogenase small subunit
MTVLDFVRGLRRLCGTKIGCREGDCGACTVLVGAPVGRDIVYRTMTSCLLPLANVHAKHVVTIEGLNLPGTLSPVQQAMADEGATQCGFCSVGFVVSLAGYCLDARQPSDTAARAAIDGNICRCTGYKSIERAAAHLTQALADRPGADRLEWLVANKFVPESFRGIPRRLAQLAASAPAKPGKLPVLAGSVATSAPVAVGGGTDLYVQRPEAMAHAALRATFDHAVWRGVRVRDGRCEVGASTTFTEFVESPDIQRLVPRVALFLEWVASSPIRNMATVAGNLANASPIGDMTILLLGLEADLHLAGPAGTRTVPLRNFYKGYKTLDRTADELITAVSFACPDARTAFNFEKVCKRTHLDIASVNTAARLEVDGGVIKHAALSAGGGAPIPLFLAKTSAFLAGRHIAPATAAEAAAMAVSEIAPITDARGSAEYKALLLQQLVYAHFLTLFPERVRWEDLA